MRRRGRIRRALWRWIFYRGNRRAVAEGLRMIVESHRNVEKDDPIYQEACEAAYTGLDDVLIDFAALLEGWRWGRP